MFGTLLKLRIRSYFAMFSSKATGKARSSGAKLGITVLFVLLYTYVLGAILFSMTALFGALASPMHVIGEDASYFGLAAIISMLIGLFTGMFTFRSQLFDARDNEALLSLPIRPSTILLSRLAVLFGSTMIYMLLVWIPALVVYAIAVGFTVLSLLTAVVSALCSVMLVLVLGCLLGWLLAIVGRHTKNKSFIGIIFSILFLVAYFYFYTKIQTTLTGAMLQPEPFVRLMHGALVPFRFIGQSAMGELVPFAILACASVALISALLWLLSRSFQALAVMSNASGVKTKKGVRATAADALPVRRALLRKELHRVFSSANCFMNSCMGAVMLALVAVGGIWKADAISSLATELPRPGMLFAFITCGFPFLLSMCNTTASSIALEGKFFPQLLSFPLNFAQIAYAKIGANVTIGMPPAIFASVALGIVLHASVLEIVLLIVAAFAMLLFSSLWGMLSALWLPRLDFPSEVHAVKQSGAVGLGLFGAMGISTVPMIGGVILSLFLPSPLPQCAVILFFALADALCLLLLHKTGDRLFARIS